MVFPASDTLIAALSHSHRMIKVGDHSLDAGRYAIASTEPLWRSALAFAA